MKIDIGYFLFLLIVVWVISAVTHMIWLGIIVALAIGCAGDEEPRRMVYPK